MDGWGIAAPGAGNAISVAKKPHWDPLFNSYPHTSLEAAGQAVGLPKGEAGNSEVGHLNLGAGRIVYQELPRINQTIADGTFLSTIAFQQAAKHLQETGGSLHLMGVVGTGVVHSSIDHLYALLWLSKELKLSKVDLHLFTDGRDSPPTNGLQLIGEIEYKLRQLGVGRIATIMGRYWAMDRDNRWDRIERAYQALIEGVGNSFTSATDAVQASYQKNITDEFIEPVVISDANGKAGLIKDGDSVIFFNFRPDRARELTKAFVEPDFSSFTNRKKINNLFFVSLVEYEKALPVSAVAFPQIQVALPLASVVSGMSLRQLHIGETEKYAHVTYFFNGGHEDHYPEEDRIHIPSQKVATYDQKPEMSAFAKADYVVQRIRESAYDFYLVNFANPDMVAHTGSLSATVKAIEIVDTCLGSIVSAALTSGGAVVITADHGNAEVMINPQTGKVDTEHSTNPVPVVFIAKQLESWPNKTLMSGILGDVAPTILTLLGITKPSSMTGRNLLAQY